MHCRGHTALCNASAAPDWVLKPLAFRPVALHAASSGWSSTRGQLSGTLPKFNSCAACDVGLQLYDVVQGGWLWLPELGLSGGSSSAVRIPQGRLRFSASETPCAAPAIDTAAALATATFVIWLDRPHSRMLLVAATDSFIDFA